MELFNNSDWEPADYAVEAIQDVMEQGEKDHVPGTWRTQSVKEHIMRARIHLDLRDGGNTDEPHLKHALCRLAMALQLEEEAADEASIHFVDEVPGA